MSMEQNGKNGTYFQRSERLLSLAHREYVEAQGEKDWEKGQEVCDKTYLALVYALNGLFMKRGVPARKIPHSLRGFDHFLRQYAPKSIGDKYHALHSKLHVLGFYQGVYDWHELNEIIQEVSHLVHKLKTAS